MASRVNKLHFDGCHYVCSAEKAIGNDKTQTGMIADYELLFSLAAGRMIVLLICRKKNRVTKLTYADDVSVIGADIKALEKMQIFY